MAYGSNMHLPDLRAWLDRHRFPTDGILDARAAVLPDFALVWNYFAAARSGGAANVEPRRQSEVHGVALCVDDATLAGIDAKEGHPTLYDRGPQPLAVRWSDDQGGVSAWVYQVVPAQRSATPVFPTSHYLGLLLEGGRAFGLSETYLESLRSSATPP